MDASALDSPLCLEVAHLVTRLEMGGPEHEWFDPMGYSYLWAAPFARVATLGGTPRLDAGPLAVPEGSAWFVRPHLLAENPAEPLSWLPADTRYLGLPGLDDDLAVTVAERFELERLVVAPAGELGRRGLEAIARQKKLTHLVLPHRLDGRALEVLSGLPELRVLLLENTEADGDALAHLAKLEKLRVLQLGRLQAGDEAVAKLRALPLEALDLGFLTQLRGKGLRGFDRLRDLSIRGVDGEGLATLAALPRLEHLELELGGSEEVSRAPLAGVASLRSLSVSVGREPLDWLRGLPGLRRARLQTRAILRPPSLEPLAVLESLVELCLPDWGMLGDDDLRPLGALRSLRALDLKSCSISGAGLAHLAGLPHLERLNLFNCFRVDAPGLAEVAKLPALRALNLGSCHFAYEDVQTQGLTDEGLAHFARCRTLKKLSVGSNRVSPKAVSALRAALPGCVVSTGYMVKAPFGDLSEEARQATLEGRLDDSERAVDRLVKECPDIPGTHVLAAELLEARRDLAGAIAAYGRAIEVEPDPEFYASRARLRSKIGDHAGAIADHDHVLAMDPSRHEHFLRRAEARFDAGDHAGAIEDYSALIDLCVRGVASASLWARYAGGVVVNRGCARLELGRLEDAERDFDRAHALDPLDGNALANRAEARFKLGRAKEALADAERALELDPSNATARVYREKAKRALG